MLPMGSFIGGSAYAMAQQISEGYLSVTERTLKRFRRPDLDQLGMELEKLLRELRGEQPSLDDLSAIQKRNRRIQRLNSTRMLLRSYRLQRRM